jgi:hypothetical protein
METDWVVAQSGDTVAGSRTRQPRPTGPRDSGTAPRRRNDIEKLERDRTPCADIVGHAEYENTGTTAQEEESWNVTTWTTFLAP